MKNFEELRTVILLRVSSKKQASISLDKNELEIPAQKQIVMDFLHKEKMNLIREPFVESGISGFKIKAKNRDAIINIMEMAKNREFDVLLVYKYDRIGRIALETPSVVDYLVSCNVKIISVVEGELRYKTHSDKLMTFIEFWKNESSSLETRQRVSDYQINMIENGRYRGGGNKTVPYGYMLVDNGSKNSKGRHVLDLIINPEESEVVKTIYNLSINYNMGARRIASYLNKDKISFKPKNKSWHYNTINYILNNSIYKGYYHINSKLYDETYMSQQLKNLIIIPENKWDENQIAIKNRQNKHNGNKKFTKGRLLLIGLAYCGHCGCKMSMSANHKHYFNKQGEKIKKVYDCYRCRSNLSRGEIICEGKTTYIAHRIDKIVEDETKLFIIELSIAKLKENFFTQLDENIKNTEKNIRQKEMIKDKLQKELITLKHEIVKAITGESEFDKSTLSELIKEKEIEIENVLNDIVFIKNESKKIEQSKLDYIKLNNNINTWVERYDNANKEDKKMLINEVINRVDIFINKVSINYKISFLVFQRNAVI